MVSTGLFFCNGRSVTTTTTEGVATKKFRQYDSIHNCVVVNESICNFRMQIKKKNILSWCTVPFFCVVVDDIVILVFRPLVLSRFFLSFAASILAL